MGSNNFNFLFIKNWQVKLKIKAKLLEGRLQKTWGSPFSPNERQVIIQKQKEKDSKKGIYKIRESVASTSTSNKQVTDTGQSQLDFSD